MYIISIDSAERKTCGEKAYSLRILKNSGLRVPDGFVVSSEAFEKFLSDTGIKKECEKALQCIDIERPETLISASKRIKEAFSRISGTDFLIREVRDAYNELSFGKEVSEAGGKALDIIKAGRTESFVSVRPSFVFEGDYFTGYGRAFLNVIGEKQILSAIKNCWLSAFSPESIFYRKINCMEKFSLAVVVQKMVDSEISGALFTSEPVFGKGEKALVEGVWGLGETLSNGAVSPDSFFIDKQTGMVEKKISKKLWLRRRGPLSGMTIQERVPASRVFMETLSERDFPIFLELSKRLEGIFNCPQKAEWCVDRGKIVLLQSASVGLSKLLGQVEKNSEADKMERLASGTPVSAGTAKGRTAVRSDLSSLNKPEGSEILVAKTLGAEILPYIRWFSGIISEQGGCGSSLSSIGRMLGIPIVCGIENATVIFGNRQEVLLDGLSGNVYKA
ncbi:MAG: PEP/pyruvate-binding domain-containing protein [Candidatus Aenigmatarchaeota archaeon]